MYSLRSFVGLPFVLALIVALVACADLDTQSRRLPLRLDISINASAGVNPDDRKRPSPILVRVYELKNADAFSDADFYTLHDKDRTALAADIAVRDQFLLRPGQQASITRDADPGSTMIGVIAAYRDLPNAVWRATWPLPAPERAKWYRRAPTLKLNIDLGVDGIKVSDPQSQ